MGEEGNSTDKAGASLAPESKVILLIPTAADFPSLAVTQHLAFQEKYTCVGAHEGRRDFVKVYEGYVKHYPAKIEHCRVVKDQGGSVIGACQLQLPGDPGDMNLPPGFRHKLLPGEIYLEWIGVHPGATGRGIGSALLRWASEYSAEHGAKFISLEVMKGNQGAVRLYERKGYVVKQKPNKDECDTLFGMCFVFCCMGCRYCSVLYMEKSLDGESTNIDTAEEVAPERMTR